MWRIFVYFQHHIIIITNKNNMGHNIFIHLSWAVVFLHFCLMYVEKFSAFSLPYSSTVTWVIKFSLVQTYHSRLTMIYRENLHAPSSLSSNNIGVYFFMVKAITQELMLSLVCAMQLTNYNIMGMKNFFTFSASSQPPTTKKLMYSCIDLLQQINIDVQQQ